MKMIPTCFSQTKSNDSDVSAQKWDSRKASVYRFFNDNQYGIIATQECEYRQKAEILANAPGYAAFGRGSEYGEDSGGSGGPWYDKKDYNTDSGNYIFYRSDKYRILESGIFWLSNTPEKISKYSASNHYRACDWVRFSSMATDRQFYVFNAHLDNSTDAVRGQQLDALWKMICEINSTNLPIVMLGVCFDDAHKSFNGFGNGGQSNIDHIAIHDFYKAKSFETDITNYGVQYISDHYPVIATLLFQ